MSESNMSCQVMVKKNCGTHYGATAGPCQKCRYFAELARDPKVQKGLQHNGTPWIAIYGRRVSDLPR